MSCNFCILLLDPILSHTVYHIHFRSLNVSDISQSFPDPFKEERVALESFQVLFASIGVMVGVLFIGVAYSFDLANEPELRRNMGLACAVLGLVSLPAMFALRDARQPADAAAQLPLIASMKEVFRNRAFRWLVTADVSSLAVSCRL